MTPAELAQLEREMQHAAAMQRGTIPDTRRMWHLTQRPDGSTQREQIPHTAATFAPAHEMDANRANTPSAKKAVFRRGYAASLSPQS